MTTKPHKDTALVKFLDRRILELKPKTQAEIAAEAAVPAAGGVMALAGLALIWLGRQRTTPIPAVCEA